MGMTNLKKHGIGFVLLVLFWLATAAPAAALTVTPNTWNVIGLDSNTPAFGPNRFPVGAKVCGGTPGQNVPVSFTWETVNPYVNLRSGSAGAPDGPPLTVTLGADGCADAYFEVEVDKNSGNAPFDTTRKYHITAGGASTPTPRELYVEHLISQFRNSISNVKLNGVSVPPGGAMNLVVGNTYTIELVGGTATQGYQQFEEFINFPNTIFQVLSVSTDYSANDSPYVSTFGHKYLYADACQWENDPNSPFYLSCVGGDYKSGGSNVVTSYTVKIVGGGGTSQSLNTLLYDFSGSSFHYNADFSTGARFANIIDPNLVTIAKNFSPDPVNAGGVSALTFTLTNPNGGAVSGLTFTDTFPTLPDAMVVATPLTTSNNCGGTLSDNSGGALAADDAGIRLTGGSIPANSSCTIRVNVAAPSTTGTYINTTSNLFVGPVDTGNSASDTLTVDDSSFPPTPPPSSCPGQEVELARWTMAPAQGTGTPPAYFSKASDVSTATASFSGGTNSISTAQGNPVNSWAGTGWAAGSPATATPYYEFVLDTSKYGGVSVTTDYYLVSGNWAAPGNNFLVIDSRDDGGSFANIFNANVPKGAWTTRGPYPAATTGTGTTTFRVRAYGAKTTADPMYLDNVVFKGCKKPDPPTLSKSFSPDPVAVGATSTLTFSVANPNVGYSLSGVVFTDTLPNGLTVATGSSAQCGGTLTTTAPSSISFAGGTLAAGGSCTITATVTATTAGPHENVSGFVTATQSGANTGSTGVASASLTAVLPPGISKQFAPNPILTGGTSTLTFTITNPNQNNALSGVAFSDTFPAAMVVANPTGASTSGCGAPVFAPVAGANSITFSGGTLAAAGNCTVTVNVTATATGANTSGNVSHIINAATVNGNTASASLTVNAASPKISLLKQVGPSATGPWSSFLAVTTPANVYYKFTVENAGDVPLSAVTVTDPQVSTASCTWPALLPVADALDDDHIATCYVAPVPAVSGSNLNTATASGTYAGNPYIDQSSARYATTGLTLAKSATQAVFTAAGNVLNYSYVVTNSGFAALAGPVTVADDKSTDESCPAVSSAVLASDGSPGDGDNYLDPGEQITCTATYTVTAADVTAKQVTNSATASTTAYGGIPSVQSNTGSKTVPLAPDLTATKTNNVGGSVILGNTFNWTLTVGNAATAGPTAFTDGQILLTDNLPDSGATYAVGAVTKAGATGSINCSIAADTLTCAASGAVSIPPALQGTVAVTNGSATVTGTGTAFTTQLTAGSIMAISGVSYAVASIQNDTQLTLTAAYAGATASGLVIPASFSVPVTVTPTAGGSLVNPKSGGACKANPVAAIAEIDQTNNDCADTVTVLLAPSLTVVKSVQAYSDPINGTTSPKAIPGAFMTYRITVINSGAGAVDDGSTVVTDPIPANTELFVGDINGAGSGPVLFTSGNACSAGTLASGLGYSYNGLLDIGDNISFSKSNGSTYDLPADIPSADANGCDGAVTHIKIPLSGPFNGASGGNNTSFCLQFRVRVK